MERWDSRRRQEEREMTLMGKGKKMGSVCGSGEDGAGADGGSKWWRQMKAGKMEVGMKAAETVA